MDPPAFRSASLGPNNSTDTTTIPKPVGTTLGDALYALVVNGGAAVAPGTLPSAQWALTAGLEIGAGGWVGVYEHVAGGSEPSSYTWAGFTDSCAGSMIAITGADPTTPTHDAHGTPTLNSNSPTDTGVTTTVPGCLIIGGAGVGDNVGVSGWTATDPAALTERTEVQSTGGSDTTSSLAAATGVQSAPGPTGVLHITLAGSRNSVVFTIAVQPPQTAGPINADVTGALAVTGSAARASNLPRPAADTLALPHGVAATVTRSRAATTALAVTSAAASATAASRAATAEATLTGAVGRAAATPRAATGTLQPAAAPAANISFARALTEALTVTGNTTVVVGQTTATTGALTVTEATTRSVTTARQTPTTVTLADIPSRQNTTPRALADALTATSGTDATAGRTAAAADPFSLTGGPARRVLLARGATDTLPLAGAAARSTATRLAGTGALTTTSAPARSLTMSRAASRTVGAAHSTARATTTPRAVAGALTVTGTPATGGGEPEPGRGVPILTGSAAPTLTAAAPTAPELTGHGSEVTLT